MRKTVALLALALLALLGTVAGAVNVQIRPGSPEVEVALRQALQELGTGDVTFTLVASAGPTFRLGGVPAFNPDVVSRSLTRGGERVVEFNPNGPLPLAQAVKLEAARVLGLPENATPQDVRARYGGADLNADGRIDLADFAILTANYGKNGSGLPGDLNGDGKVDGVDLQLFSKFYTLP
ncbi:hypothetical protein [Deinococcus peraridilitoris]|uniref:hypothetical protein n=1 Tax=Deinococcus peraridilitoris TaxID=432329 RepID=UPI00059E4FC9|nr:hypothetical protein [Deinococcus peraridilitoris]